MSVDNQDLPSLDGLETGGKSASSSTVAVVARPVSESKLASDVQKYLHGAMPYLAALGAAGFAYYLHSRSTPRTVSDVVKRAARDFARVLRG